MQGENMPDAGRMLSGEKSRTGRGGRGGRPGGRPRGRDLGRAIRQLRRERKLTIEALALISDVHPTYLSSIERGHRNPSWEKLCAIADGLDIELAAVVLRAESAERVRRGLEMVLSEERERCSSAEDLGCANRGR